jgi:hypothetical protein
MLTLIKKYFLQYCDVFPSDAYSMFITNSIDNGLLDVTNIMDFKKSCGITNDHQLYLMLRKSPALHKYMIFHHTGPDFQLKLTPLAIQENQQYVLTSTDVELFHHTIFSTVRTWTLSDHKGFSATLWRNALNNGINEAASWDEIKLLLEIDDIQEYFYLLLDCDGVQQQFLINFDAQQQCFSYTTSQCADLMLESTASPREPALPVPSPHGSPCTIDHVTTNI